MIINDIFYLFPQGDPLNNSKVVLYTRILLRLRSCTQEARSVQVAVIAWS